MIIYMKKRRGTRLFILILVMGSACACLALAACNINLSVNPIYQDAKRNWISDLGFSVARGATSSGWAFDYAGSTEDTFAYMSLTDTGATVLGSLPEGLDASAEAYRLSINNLMPDPDFALGSFSAMWFAGFGDTAPGAPSMTFPATGNISHGDCLAYSRSDNGQYIRPHLSDYLLNAAGAGTGPAGGSIYQINFLFYGTNPQINYSPDLNDKLQLNIAPSAVNDVHLQTQSFDTPADDYYLYFGPDGVQTTAYVDDIRVVRKAIPLYFSLDLKLSDATPAFISGRYVFSVWVKNDASASYLLSGGAAAPYQARALTLEIRALSRSDGGAIGVFHPSDMTAGWSDWTRLDLEFPAGEKLAIDQTETDPVFSLKISPADLSSATGLDASSIMIAQPSLSFHYE
jgi:hypothetical protein